MGAAAPREKTRINLKKNDTVTVVSGRDAGKQGKVLRTIPHKRQVVVQNLNYVWKHLRRSQQNPQGGRIHKEAPLPISKVMVVCQSCGEPSRVYRKRQNDKGESLHGQRFCKKCDGPVSGGKK
jgi:large subunit ribosomal protein L24